MRAPRFSSESGVAGVALTIVIAWALVAVLLLTGTLISAQSIHERVSQISTETGDIDRETDQVALLQQTEQVAEGIRAAAAPLSGQLDRVDRLTVTIDKSVVDILDNVKTINGSVDSINSSLSGVLATARSIDEGVAAINVKAVTIIGLANGIDSDLTGTLRHVRSIDRSAASIDCRTGGAGGCLPLIGSSSGSREARSGSGRGVGGVRRLVEGVASDLGNILSLGAGGLNATSASTLFG